VSYVDSIVHFEAERVNEAVTPWVAPKTTRWSRSPARRFRNLLWLPSALRPSAS